MIEGIKDGFETEEIIPMVDFKVETLAENGLGYGHGSIDGNMAEQPEVAAQLENALSSPRLLVAVDRDPQTGDMLDDDGCGDGRAVSLIKKAGTLLKRSLNRAKVFGGGAAMTVAGRIANGLSKGAPLQHKYKDAIGQLNENGVDYGAHTADRVGHDSECGCGAIDKAPEIVASTVRYETEIRGSIAALGVLNYEGAEGELDEVYAHYREEAALVEGQPYSGKEVSDDITKDGRVSKELTGPHLERAVVLNMVRGFTVDQQFVREATDDEAQVFAVDVWRLQDLAARNYPNDVQAQRKAFFGELIYTLATAAVLTKGNLKVVVASPTELPEAA